jgi:hypothetical protein
MRINLLLAFIILIGMRSLAQDMNNVSFPEMLKTSARKEIRIPNILGFQTLKCDFHMHTIFSDGVVWPTVRVDEAWEEGLDAIAITDHIENQPSKKYVAGDHNASYEIAMEQAKEKNILLIHSGEITREMPPGHLNALFINDANKLDVSDLFESMLEAKKQGAFIQWNHPGWKAQQPDTCLWMAMHQKLFEKGLINGIEVFNEQEYYPIVLDWCLNRKLSVLCNSDIHGTMAQSFDLQKYRRPMTLVFANDRSLESIKEAMFAQRTVAFFNNKLAGKEEFLKAVFEASVKVKSTGSHNKDGQEIFEITNNSAISFDMQSEKGEQLFLPAETSLVLAVNRNEFRRLTVKNLYTGSESNLKIDLF